MVDQSWFIETDKFNLAKRIAMKLSIKILILVISTAFIFAVALISLFSNLTRDRLSASQSEWVETLAHAVSEGITLNTINGDMLVAREKLQTIVQNDIALEYAYVTDFDGDVFTHTFEGGFPRALIHQLHEHPEEHNVLQPMTTNLGDILDITHPLINGMDAHLHLGVNQTEINALIQETNEEIIFLVFILTFVATIIFLLFAQRITTPLYRLANFMYNYGKGDLTETINIGKASYEVRELANAFNQMIEDRQDLEVSLIERDMIYRRLVDSTTAIPWELDLADWRFNYVGQQIVELLGYPVDDWYTENFWADHIHPEDRDYAIAYCKSETALGHDHVFEYRMIDADSQIVWIRCDVTIIYNEGTPVRLQGFMFDITAKKTAELEHQQHMELMQQKQYSFLEWAKSKDLDLQTALHKATELSGDSLKTDRVSIWLYNPERTAIVCEDLYTSKDQKHNKGIQLAASDFPTYFSALETNRTLAISDARHEPETSEFSESYLIPLDIYSMLDVPIRKEGKVIGVVCHEHTGQPRDWTLEQQDFAASIANTVALAIETEERKRAEEEVQDYREHLEELVDKRTAELAAVNQELESFSYSVSHDLRSPLRAIDGFSLALLEDYANSVDENGKDYLQRIRNNTLRMGELIDDLLALSQLGRTPLNLQTINLSTITNEILLTLSNNQKDREVKYLVENTQDTRGDPKLIKVILENLLQNAWKYTGNTSQPEIEFGTRQKNNETIYYVKDNGAGFDMKFADNLFGAFQRLHGAEFEGTGIGLATVQRLISRHGGHIWAEAVVDQGATFYFTLQ